MAIPQYRGKQTTATTGTGTLTLDAAAANLRSMQVALGSSAVKARFVISSATGYEVFVGTYDGASPGTITRDTVIASSNAGALVNWGAGTKDVFVLPDFDRPILSISGGTTLTLADLGNLVSVAGSASATINLPAIATVPPGSGFEVVNGASYASGAIVTLDPSGAETVNGATTAVMAPGERCTLYRVGSAWIAAGLGTGLVTLRRQTTISSQTVIDFVLPAGFEAFQLRARGLAAASGTPGLYMRFSTDGGSTFLAGASDYYWGALDIEPGPAARAASYSGSEIQIWSAMQSSLALGHNGVIDIAGAADAAMSTSVTAHLGFARAGVVNAPSLTGGATQASAVHNAVRLVISTSVAFRDGAVVTQLGLR